jgi:ketosteroid isomerase-like protein
MPETQKEEILELVAEWRNALENRDLDQLLSNYRSDAVIYDCKPPYKRVGVESMREMWLGCLPYLPEKFKCEHRDLEVHVNGNMAFVHGLHTFVSLVDVEKWDCFTWVRITVCYEKDVRDGKWWVVHEHCSVPFDPLTSIIAKITP